MKHLFCEDTLTNSEQQASSAARKPAAVSRTTKAQIAVDVVFPFILHRVPNFQAEAGLPEASLPAFPDAESVGGVSASSLNGKQTYLLK